MIQKSFTYRGSLKSCNYACNYCPFAKHTSSQEQQKKDEKSWWQFCKQVQNMEEDRISILIAPYGEALIHAYYTEGMASLSKLKQVGKIGCQTNLSIEVGEWIKQLETYNADFDKITLWCTYHPSMVDITTFVEKIIQLSSKINLSVGVVGDPEQIVLIQKLRECLPLHIYLWINKMDGLRRKYTQEEINIFQKIDPMFALELTNKTKAPVCEGGKQHFFVNANGSMQPCNRNRTVLGNLYEQDENIYRTEQAFVCQSKKCDCYLAYAHHMDVKLLHFFGNQKLQRVPQRLKLQALFIDVDGTLLTKDGMLESGSKEAIKYLSQKMPIYLVTELPYTYAMKRCNSIKAFLTGGCFAKGAHLVDFQDPYEHYTYLPEEIEQMYPEALHFEKHQNRPYKARLKHKLPKALKSQIISQLMQANKYQLTNTQQRTSILSQGVSKWQGIEQLCSQKGLDLKQIMTVGNSLEDIEMISKAPYSVAVPTGIGMLKNKATYILEIRQLPYIL